MAVTFDSIATQTITGSASNSLEFTGISNTYTDLYLIVKAKRTTGDADVRIRFNNDSSAAYATGSLYVTTSGGKGSSFLIGLTSGYLTNWGYDSPNSFGCHEVYILNYGSNKHKSWCSEAGSQNGNDLIQGLWQSTSAISSIQLFATSGTWVVGTTAELYGIKAA
jgi:hypothetical protein